MGGNCHQIAEGKGYHGQSPNPVSHSVLSSFLVPHLDHSGRDEEGGILLARAKGGVLAYSRTTFRTLW